MTLDSLVSPALLRQGRVLESTAAMKVTFSQRMPLDPSFGRPKYQDCLQAGKIPAQDEPSPVRLSGLSKGESRV